jgi:hypothetical protein
MPQIFNGFNNKEFDFPFVKNIGLLAEDAILCIGIVWFTLDVLSLIPEMGIDTKIVELNGL